MRFDSFSSSSERRLEDKLKRDLKNAENEQERLRLEIDRLEGEKQQILKQLSEIKSEHSEEDMLAMVYQQRRGGGGR
ncbi:MAG: hypothetical protein IJ679_08020 [Lachnospiraceae bacterium]|nr:hypothetical protein [Lachnospiraceae bacterium]